MTQLSTKLDKKLNKTPVSLVNSFDNRDSIKKNRSLTNVCF